VKWLGCAGQVGRAAEARFVLKGVNGNELPVVATLSRTFQNTELLVGSYGLHQILQYLVPIVPYLAVAGD